MLEAAALVLLAALGRSPMPLPAQGDEDAPVPPFSYDFAQPQRLEVGGKGPTRVSLENQMPMPVWGYGLLPVSIDNTTGPAQTVRLRYESNAGGGGRTVERLVELRPGERTQVLIPIPSALRYGRLSVRAPGVVEGSEPNVYFTYVYRPQRVALSIGAAEDFEKLVGQRPVNTDPSVLVMPIGAQDAPSDLSAYVGFDAVAVAQGTFEALPEGVQRALEAYAATGGVLVLAQAPRTAATVLPLLDERAGDGSARDYGFGTVVAAREGTVNPDAFRLAGQVVKPQGARPSWQRRHSRLASAYDEVLLPQALAPLGRFLFIIVLFTLAIGPGSVWVARKKGPGALLVTIPGTAFVTCALIIGYSLVRDGFTVHAGVHGYSLLDRARNRVITASVGAFYANLAPGQAVFPQTTAVVAPLEGNSTTQAAGVAWTQGARYGPDFLPSRSYREWGVVGVEPTRARLVLKGEAGAYKAQNALGARVSTLCVRAGDAHFLATDLRDGGEVVLAPVPDCKLPDLGALPATRFGAQTGLRVRQRLRDGEFLALLEGPAFADLGGLAVRHHRSSHLVRGEVER